MSLNTYQRKVAITLTNHFDESGHELWDCKVVDTEEERVLGEHKNLPSSSSALSEAILEIWHYNFLEERQRQLQDERDKEAHQPPQD